MSEKFRRFINRLSVRETGSRSTEIDSDSAKANRKLGLEPLSSFRSRSDMALRRARPGGSTTDSYTRPRVPLCTSIGRPSGDAYVYRSDFIIGGLYAMNVRFSHMRSRSGWFFGTRPEFHFPKLPLGWATLGTWLFLPPLTIAAWLTAIALLLGTGVLMVEKLKPDQAANTVGQPEHPKHVIVFSEEDLSNPYQLIAAYENGQAMEQKEDE